VNYLHHFSPAAGWRPTCFFFHRTGRWRRRRRGFLLPLHYSVLRYRTWSGRVPPHLVADLAGGEHVRRPGGACSAMGAWTREGTEEQVSLVTMRTEGAVYRAPIPYHYATPYLLYSCLFATTIHCGVPSVLPVFSCLDMEESTMACSAVLPIPLLCLCSLSAGTWVSYQGSCRWPACGKEGRCQAL